jgi:hypothetical protein
MSSNKKCLRAELNRRLKFFKLALSPLNYRGFHNTIYFMYSILDTLPIWSISRSTTYKRILVRDSLILEEYGLSTSIPVIIIVLF